MKAIKYPINKKCQECGDDFPCYKRQQLVKRKYCSHECAYKSKSWKSGRAEHLTKVGGVYRKRENLEYGLKQYNIKQTELKNSTKVKMKNGDILDITYGELAIYRATHSVCDICLNPERMSSSNNVAQPNKLAVDHDHKTMKFRGLLCSDCNRKLGWYEKFPHSINNYLVTSRGIEPLLLG